MVTAISFYILQINFFLSVKENPEFPSLRPHFEAGYPFPKVSLPRPRRQQKSLFQSGGSAPAAIKNAGDSGKRG
jgi:hypothetical protein